MIHIENLVKRYGDLVALNHLNLDIHEGEIFGLLGPNGSGKTTAINCLLSLLKYDKGTIEVFGQPMTPESYQVKQQIGIVLQNVAVFDELTVYENIDYFCGLYVSDKKRRKELVNEAIQFVGLEDYCKTRPGKLSGGLLRRLNIACGIAHKPRLIIMDEPTVAVDPQSRNKILEGIQKLNEQGSTMVCSFLAGLMNSNMKDLVEKHAPIINRINPAALISDAFYCINVYNDTARYYRNLVTLAVMSAAFVMASFLLIRRNRYDSI